MNRHRPPLGATVTAEGTHFRTYARRPEGERPDLRCQVQVRLFDGRGTPIATHPLTPVPDRSGEPTGDFEALVAGVGHGTLYKFVLDGRELPDPHARFLPQGVHGPAMVVEPRHAWSHGEGIERPLAQQVIYELHVGTFTPEGTYAAARARLPELVALGVTTIELLPLAAFPGTRGWGYDGVAHFAPFAPYGEPDELRALVDEAHRLGLGVLLDVVYNHLGPAGNYLGAYSPEYFTREVPNPWGEAPDFRRAPMRRHLLDNALYWLREYRFDGLRLDATHAIVDPSPEHGGLHILRELVERVRELRPRKLLIAEDDRNQAGLVTDLGLDAVWADDFHHALRVTLTGEQDGYYANYRPGAEGIAETVRRGWLYTGQNYPGRDQPRGTPAAALPAEAFVYCIQNHDQVGNRATGDRLHAQVDPAAYAAASTLLLCLPMTPLLFMGQEWAASSPFQFFTDHDPELGRLICAGRRKEFAGFAAFGEEVPDPQALETWQRSRLDWEERRKPEHARVLELYSRLLRLRREDPVLARAGRAELEVSAEGPALLVRRWLAGGGAERTLVVNFGREPLPLERLGRAGAFARRAVLFRSDGRPIGEPTPAVPALTALLFA